MSQEVELIGWRIYRIRLRLGWTQRDLARRSDLPLATLSSYEQGLRAPGAMALAALAKSLGVTADHLLGLDGHDWATEPGTDAAGDAAGGAAG